MPSVREEPILLRTVLQIKWAELLKPFYWIAPLVLSAILLAMEQFSYLLFHSVAEGLSIIVAAMMAVTAWQTYDLSRDRLFMFLGCGFFWVAVIDMAHAFVFKGMNILPIESANPATQLWIGARYLEALTILLALLRLNAPPAPGWPFGGIGVVALGIIAAVWVGIFPDAYIEPTGLTPFKIISEYIIIAILAGCLILLGQRQDQLPPTVIAPLGMAIILTIGSELAFTFYVGVYDLSNLVGHIFKLFAFWFVLIAIVRTTLDRPFSELRVQTQLQEQTANDLRESEERLLTIMGNAQDAIVMIDARGRVMFWNAAAERMFGHTETEAMGRDVHELLAPPENMPLIKKRLAAFGQTGQGPVIGVTVGLDARRRDGVTIPVELSVSSVHYKNEWAAIATARDLTERREAERQLRQLQKSDAIESMAAGIAHDFKNMLLPIISLTGMCLSSLPKDSREHIRLEKVLEAANRAADLAKRILNFSHEDKPVVEETDLSELARETAEFLRSTTLKNIAITTDIEPGLIAAIDAEQIVNVLVNLGNNAADAMGDKIGAMAIGLTKHTLTYRETLAIPRLKPGRPYGVLTVSDEGIGMDEPTIARIFDPFFTTKEVGHGTGLGLPVAHSIVTKHGGAIGVKSTPGKGTKFTVYLPLVGA
ncbi:MAG: PAS domain S-box protein [Rhodospirillales bacterium]|nr:PAS domain S-box protein [Rhodospirillales bacterium]